MVKEFPTIEAAVEAYRDEEHKIRVTRDKGQTTFYFSDKREFTRILRKVLHKRWEGKGKATISRKKHKGAQSVQYETEKKIYSEGWLFSDRFVTNDAELAERLCMELDINCP